MGERARESGWGDGYRSPLSVVMEFRFGSLVVVVVVVVNWVGRVVGCGFGWLKQRDADVWRCLLLGVRNLNLDFTRSLHV